MTTDDPKRAYPLICHAVAAYQQLGQEHEVAWALWALSVTSWGISSFQETIDLASQSLAAFRKFDDRSGISHVLTALGEYARFQGDYETARTYYQESLAISIETGERSRETIQYCNLSFAYYHRQQYELALKYARRALEMGLQLGIALENLSIVFIAYAGIYTARGQPASAAQLLGATQSMIDHNGYIAQQTDSKEYQAITHATRLAMTEEDYEAAWQAGYQLSKQQVLTLTSA